MHSKAKTVEEYIQQLPENRKDEIGAVRKVILDNLPAGIEENMNWGMISYEVPLSVCPDTYNNKPLMYAALDSQKNHMSIYLSAIYANDDLRDEFEQNYQSTGNKLDIGKSCVRFKKIDNLSLDVIGQAIGAVSVHDFIEFYHKNRTK